MRECSKKFNELFVQRVALFGLLCLLFRTGTLSFSAELTDERDRANIPATNVLQIGHPTSGNTSVLSQATPAKTNAVQSTKSSTSLLKNAAFLSKCLWPAFALVFVLIFRKQIIRLMECIETFSLPWGGTVTLRKKLEAKVIPKQEPPKATGEVLDGPTTGELEKANDIATESRAWKLDNVREEVYRLAREFEEIERGRGYSAEQFSRMRRVFAAMRALGIAQRPFQNDLRKGSLGERLAAVAGCQVLPVDADVGFLFDLLRHLLYRRSESGPRKNYSPFVIYQSIIALMTLVEMDNKGEPGFVLADWQEQILERIWEIDLQELMTQVDDEGRQSLLCIVRRSQAVIAKKARESTEADERNRNRRIAEDERRKEILAGGDGPNIEFRKSGKIISWSSKAKDILELAEIHGIDIPWTCKSGSCSTCRTKLLSGKIKYNHTVHTSCGTDECLVCSCVPAGPIALDA